MQSSECHLKKERQLTDHWLSPKKSGKQRKSEWQKKKERAEAAKSGKDWYLDRIDKIKKQLLENDDAFKAMNMYQLKAKKEQLAMFERCFEEKCADLKRADPEADQTNEIDVIDALAELLNSKLIQRIAELTQPTSEATSQASGQAIPTPESQAAAQSEVQAAIVQAAPVETTFGQFDGNMDRWHAFIERFGKEVHKADMQPDQKLALLTQACTGEARKVISNAGNDYQKAIESLDAQLSRYCVLIPVFAIGCLSCKNLG